MKKVSVVALALAGMLSSASAFATWSSNPVSISAVEVHQDEDRVYLYFATQPTGQPCGNSKVGKWDITTDSGKSMLAVANAAFLAGKSVTVNWAASCTGSYIYIQGISMS